MLVEIQNRVFDYDDEVGNLVDLKTGLVLETGKIREEEFELMGSRTTFGDILFVYFVEKKEHLIAAFTRHHRLDGPSVVYSSGRKDWHINGRFVKREVKKIVD